MRRVLVDNPGDTKFLPGALADRFDFRDSNDSVRRHVRATTGVLSSVDASRE